MSRGKSIYFTNREIEVLLRVLRDWEDNATEDLYALRLKHGLGKAWFKLIEAKNNG